MRRDGARVLIIDDEPPIRRLLRNTLRVQDYEVSEAATGGEGLTQFRHQKPDIVILDLGLPDMDGIDVLRSIRETSETPIIVLSSWDDEHHKVRSLDLGADDYVTKPFGIEELLARMRTALRHRVQREGGRPLFTNGRLAVDLVRRIVCIAGAQVRLSPKEYEILEQLVIHAGKVVTHRHLLQRVWGGESDEEVQYLRVYIRQLRQKVEEEPSRPQLILTEPGVGYRLQAPAGEQG